MAAIWSRSQCVKVSLGTLLLCFFTIKTIVCKLILTVIKHNVVNGQYILYLISAKIYETQLYYTNAWNQALHYYRETLLHVQ